MPVRSPEIMKPVKTFTHYRAAAGACDRLRLRGGKPLFAFAERHLMVEFVNLVFQERENPATLLIEALPEAVADSYCGVGNPFALGTINEGEAAGDIGCGSGVDAIFAAMMTGPSGNVVGVDLTPEMLQRAKKNLGCTDLKNITFGVAGSRCV